MMKAPVVIFCYTRLDLLKKTVAALLENTEAAETEVFFYSDGGRDEVSWKKVQKVRKYVHGISGFKKVTVVEQKENKQLEFNVIQGITEVVEKYGRVIVVEDDIIVSKYFLTYMNLALEFYNDCNNVMEITGFNPCVFPQDFPQTFCMQLPMGLGWATWKDRWKKFIYFKTQDEALKLLSDEDKKCLEFDGAFPCLKMLALRPVPWDICWYISIFLSKGVCLCPVKSLTRHIGINGSHYTQTFFTKLLHNEVFDVKEVWQEKNIAFTVDTQKNTCAENVFRNYLLNFEYNTIILRIIQKALLIVGHDFYYFVRKLYLKFFTN